MFLQLLFLLTFIPLMEIYFLLKISHVIGGMNTLVLIFITGFLGAWLLRRQGHSILLDLQTSHRHHQLPSEAITRGLFTFIGGLLLLTPGIFTDILGLSFILPITQTLWKKYFIKIWQRGLAGGQIRFYSNIHRRDSHSSSEKKYQNRLTDPDVIDIEVQKSQTTDKKEDL